MNTRFSITDLIDRHGDRMLQILAIATMLFFAGFLLALSSAMNAMAEALPHKCGGVNLLEGYKQSDPGKYKRLRTKADQELNGQGIFWRVEKEGHEPSYLFGTMHMADERIANIPGKQLLALKEAQTVIVENVEALDPKTSSSAIMKYQEMVFYTDGKSIADKLDEETLEQLKGALQARGIPYAAAHFMRPWLIATMVAMPPCEMANKQTGELVLDARIVKEAQDSGKKLVGLETIGEQFSALSSTSEQLHLVSLKETLALGETAQDMMETLKQLYLAGDIGMILPLTRDISPQTTKSEEFKDFSKSLIVNRNRHMAKRAITYLEKGKAFIAVGAMHLPGETGLVNAFREAGFKVTAVQ